MKLYVPLLSNIFFVSVVCGIMLGAVYYLASEDALEAVVVAFLLFNAIDMGLRGILNKPSWILTWMNRKKKKK
jgi:uncharacterized membrane protein YfcA